MSARRPRISRLISRNLRSSAPCVSYLSNARPGLAFPGATGPAAILRRSRA